MAAIYKGTLGLIGNTPLVEPVNLEKELGLEATILVKLEYLNPAGSVKDRIALDVRIALIAAIVFAVVFFTTRYVSVGSLTITALFPILMLIFYPGQWVVFGLSLIFTALAWWRHRANIKRLMNGTENKFEKKKK